MRRKKVSKPIGLRQSNALRIAILTSEYPSVSQTFVTNQIEGLRQRGQQVHVYAKRAKESKDITCITTSGTTLSKTIHLILIFLSILFRQPSAALRLLLHAYRYRRANATFTLTRQLLHKPPQIILAHFAYNAICAMPAARALRIPVVVMMHGSDIREVQGSSPALCGSLFRYCQRFLAISPQQFQRIESFGVQPHRIVQHPVGIDTSAFMPSARKRSKSHFQILSVGRAVPEKDPLTALKIIKKLKDSAAHFTYTYIGDGPLLQQMKSYVKEHALEEYVNLKGACTPSQVLEHLHKTDAFLLTSVEEITPVVLMEAQACAVPIVTTGVGDISQVVTASSAYIHRPGNIKGMSDSLLNLSKDTERAKRMGKAGRVHVKKKYDINILNDRLLQLLEREVELLANPSSLS